MLKKRYLREKIEVVSSVPGTLLRSHDVLQAMINPSKPLG